MYVITSEKFVMNVQYFKPTTNNRICLRAQGGSWHSMVDGALESVMVSFSHSGFEVSTNSQEFPYM